MPDKFNELTNFLDSQLDKLHVLADKPQDVNFEDVTEKSPAIAKGYKYTLEDAQAAIIEEQEFIAFAERRTNTPPRCKQQILDDMAFINSLTPEEKEIHRKLELEQKIEELQANKAEMFYKMNLTTQEKIAYNELKEQERQANFNKALSKMKFI